MSYWEYEITQRNFDELMFYIKTKREQHNVLIKLNTVSEDKNDVTICSMMEYFRYNEKVENIRDWIAQNYPEQHAIFELRYPNGAEW